MKKRVIAFLLVTGILVLALASCAMAVSTVKYVYTRNSRPLNVRVWPDTKSALLGTIPNGTAVTVEGYTTDYTWAYIVYNGQNAYVMTQYLVDTYPGGGSTPTPVPGGEGTYQRIVSSLENEFRTYRVVEPYTVLAKPTRATGWVNLRYVPSTEFGHAMMASEYERGNVISIHYYGTDKELAAGPEKRYRRYRICHEDLYHFHGRRIILLINLAEGGFRR